MASVRGLGADQPNERTRMIVTALIGLIAGAITALFEPWQLSVLVAWDVTVVLFVVWVWLSVGGLDSTETARVATAEDNTRQGTRVLLLGAALASLVGVALALIKTRNESGAIVAVMTVAGVLTVLLSWALVHTLFALRYAHLYYADGAGGIDFKTDDPPDFIDFAYMGFTVGMTFQVSDTDIQLRSIRRAVLRHALLAYVFGTVIIAVTINVIAGFVR
jgi:uncharacterized membrane protein